jgi:hypothetical protein
MMDNPFGGVPDALIEIPFSIDIENTPFTIMSNGGFDHCINDNKKCFRNNVAPYSWTNHNWRITGLPAGTYNIIVKLGNDGDNKIISRTINVGSATLSPQKFSSDISITTD